MIQTIDVTLPKPHAAQKQILSEAKRFNVLCNGRRWGKTKLSIRLIKPAITNAEIIGYWSPTYKDLSEVWREIKHRLQPITKRKDEQTKQIELTTGGIIDMWSLDDPDSGRGRKYNRAIVDEFEKAKHGEYAWSKTIRATLADYRGDAWFLSTPKGVNTYFSELFENEKKYNDWKSWQMPTTTNPYIDPAEIEAARLQLDPITFRQEFLAEFISTADRPFMYCFEDRHISENAVYQPNFQIYLSFDFNVNPMTCSISQEGMKDGKPFIYFIDEIYLQNSDISEVCRTFKTKYPNVNPAQIMVTGDASGKNRSGMIKGSNYYTIIEKELKIRPSQVRVNNSNYHYSDSIVLCNSLLSAHPNLKFHPVNCKNTIYDMRFTEWDGTKIIKDNRNKREQQSDLLDCVRYRFQSFNHKFIKNDLRLHTS
jgi:hypothetical protein